MSFWSYPVLEQKNETAAAGGEKEFIFVTRPKTDKRTAL
jgi:hypothetical protein